MLENKEMHDKRRKQQLSRRWNRIVFAPMNDKIRNVMDGEGLANLQRRKRELHQEYIDIVNRRVSLLGRMEEEGRINFSFESYNRFSSALLTAVSLQAEFFAVTEVISSNSVIVLLTTCIPALIVVKLFSGLYHQNVNSH